MYNEPAKGTLLALNIAIGSILYKAIQIHAYGLNAFITFERDIQTKVGNLNESLFSLNNNIPSYMIGLLLGHFMVKDLKIRAKLSPFFWWFFLNTTFTVFVVVIFALSLPFKLSPSIESLIGVEYASVVSIFTQNELPYLLKLWIGSTFQTAVSLCFALFCYLCYNESRLSDEAESFTLLNHVTKLLVNLLSCKLFVVLGRISLPMMMAHYLVIEYMKSVMTDSFPVEFGEVLLRAPFVFFMSIFLGLVIHMTIESPFKKVLSSFVRGTIVDENNNIVPEKTRKIE